MKKTNLNLARELATAYAANLPHDALREQLEALGCPRLAIDAAFADNLAPSAVEAMDERRLDAAIETAAREIVDALERHAAAAALGRMGGASTSPAKQAASRVNGAKGGRPQTDLSRAVDETISILDKVYPDRVAWPGLFRDVTRRGLTVADRAARLADILASLGWQDDPGFGALYDALGRVPED